MTSKLYTYACSCPAVFPSIHFRIHSNVDLHNQVCIGTDQYPEGKLGNQIIRLHTLVI